ncbi:MAG: amidase [Gammaproteobacteria bacterium]|nr:amidase [Gammaproteobacteria bacterium]
MSNAREIGRLDALSLAAKVRDRSLSALEVTEATLARLAALEPEIHAFTTVTEEQARAAARAVDARLAAGDDPGPLAGVPLGIKDLVATAGVRTAMGSPLYRDFVPDEDDIVVERLKAAGAIIIGKTNVPEFGYSGASHNPIGEATRNPWDTRLTPGGSSSGSGAAVAAGIGPFAIGSDGGGSIRVPAAHCGLVGFKPSMGRVPLYPGCRDPRYPGLSSWESLEHIGPISRTVADAALMMQVIAGPDPRDRYSIPAADFDYLAATHEDFAGLRIAYSEDWGYAAVDPEVRQVVREAARTFATDLGCHVEEARPGWGPEIFASFWALVAADTDLTGMRRLMQGREHTMSPHLVELLRHPWTAEDFTDAKMMRLKVCQQLSRLMQDFDLLLTPTVAVPPFALYTQGPEMIEGRMVAPTAWLAFTFPLNMSGQPAISVPAGFTSSGLPIGMQIVGRHLDDRSVLRAAAAFERARPWAAQWPPLLEQLGL